jgi:hypothetical protein
MYVVWITGKRDFENEVWLLLCGNRCFAIVSVVTTELILLAYQAVYRCCRRYVLGYGRSL